MCFFSCVLFIFPAGVFPVLCVNTCPITCYGFGDSGGGIVGNSFLESEV